MEYHTYTGYGFYETPKYVISHTRNDYDGWQTCYCMSDGCLQKTIEIIKEEDWHIEGENTDIVISEFKSTESYNHNIKKGDI